MKRSYTLAKLAAVITALPLVLGLSVAETQPALATASTQNDWHTQVGNNWKTTICHRTHAVTNPYRRITVSDSSVYGNSGHSNPNHDRDYTVGGVTYHVYTSTITYPSNSKFWGDIIPPQNPLRYSNNPNSVETSGMNWITEGIAIALTSTTFQLAKKYTSGAQVQSRLIRKPIATGFAILVSGVPPTYTLDATTGIVTIAAAPAASAITWSGEFDVPVRYDTDQLDGQIVGRNADGLLYTWQSIPLIEDPTA